MGFDSFHPAVRRWFAASFEAPTPVQLDAWRAIAARRHAVICAPTGSGKTLAGFLAVIDDLARQASAGRLGDRTEVLYVSPLKALSNDIQKNLQEPLLGIAREMLGDGLQDSVIRTAVRTGDTPQSERARMRRQPPHILVTTPESLYILLTSDSGRGMLSTVKTVIVDEVHALAGNKRGAHLGLSLERLNALCPEPPVRVGISATVRPIETIAEFITGATGGDCEIIDSGHERERDLGIELPRSPLEAIMANEVWTEIYDRLAELIEAHRTTLIFVNTRRLAERAARHLAERLGEAFVTSHHGSLAKEHRLRAEQALKEGKLKALVATSSLELGIDIGDVDLVCQLGSPHAIAALLQRVGRSGHGLRRLPKGRLFPLSRDELVECAALLDSVRRGELDAVRLCRGPLDVLAQQVVAEVGLREWPADELLAAFRRSASYRDLDAAAFEDLLTMLADGFSTQRGRRAAQLHYDRVNGILRGRRGARLTAITNGGVIPDQFDYDVVLLPNEFQVGTLNEDFAFESMPGDIFQLGNTSYRILKIQTGKVYVEDARGQPPSIPFWFGEAPGRSDELSAAVSKVRRRVAAVLASGSLEQAKRTIAAEFGLADAAASQLVEYLGAALAALGELPSDETVIFERFFDEAGDTHLVVHSTFGSRLNRAWGLALRKRFCRRFNFELQAAALEDSIVLSLGTVHSFALEEVIGYLRSRSVRGVLEQAVLGAPIFPTYWRWNATAALAVRRFRNGKKTPPQFQRSDAEDLLATVFPDQLACAENLPGGDIAIPEHPLVRQTMADCLTAAMDIAGLERLLARVEAGELRVVCRDLVSPSPLAQEILGAKAYAFLDGAPAEERRTLAVNARRYMNIEQASDLGRLDPKAIERVRREAWPEVRDADELHDALAVLGFATEAEVAAGGDGGGWSGHAAALERDGRASRFRLPTGAVLWVAAERLAELQLLFPDGRAADGAARLASPVTDADEALRELIRSRLEAAGPVTAAQLAAPFGFDAAPADAPPVGAASSRDDRAKMALLQAGAQVGAASSRDDRAKMALPQAGAQVGAASSRDHRAATAPPPRRPIASIDAALAALEQQGFAMRGAFTGAAELEWCERRLLARIHRYTLNRLRSEIEPASLADYQRFLFRWQGLGNERREGPESLRVVLGELQGLALPAAVWERDVLPARLSDYVPSSLDELSRAGEIVWWRPRLAAANASGATVAASPIAIVPRHRYPAWSALTGDGYAVSSGLQPRSSRQDGAPTGSSTGRSGFQPRPSRQDGAPTSSTGRSGFQPRPSRQDGAPTGGGKGRSGFQPRDLELSSAAARVRDTLRERGASFFVDLVQATGLLRVQVEDALGELVARGLVTADAFHGLRALVAPQRRRPRFAGRRTRAFVDGFDAAGRWSLLPDAPSAVDRAAAVETAAEVLLRRYGVVARAMLMRESLAPPWRELLEVFRRWEARGEIRGGRFVEPLGGEQFALSEAVERLRRVRGTASGDEWIAISAADPLNLCGIVAGQKRIAAIASHRLVYCDGVPVAARSAGETEYFGDLSPAQRSRADAMLRPASALGASRSRLRRF